MRNRLNGIEVGHDRHADHVDAKVLRRILAEHDWPGHRLVGLDAARAAWSLALHADEDPDLQRAATTLLQRAIQDGDAPVTHWAHLHDRTLANTSSPQEYGTQQMVNATGVHLCPVRDPDCLDERRASVGLPPIADALETRRRRLATAGLVEDVATVMFA